MQQLLQRVEIRRPDLKLVESAPPPAAAETEENEEYQAVIDQALHLVYSQYHRAVSQLNPDKATPFTLKELREGPLGEDLSRLAQVARGTSPASREGVLGAIDSVLHLLFWPVGAEFFVVPRAFWDQPLGRMLSLAKLRLFEPHELVSISQAANHLNVTRATIYRWIDERVLDFVRDDASGHTFIVRADVEALMAEIEAEVQAPKGENEEDAYPLLAEPAIRALATLAAPEGPTEWGDPEESAREDREIMAAFAPLRRAAEEAEESKDLGRGVQ